MTIEQLKEAHQSQPFHPFVIHMADGEKVSVPHREFLSHSPSGRTVLVAHDDDSWSVIDLLLVARLGFLASKGRGGKNGKSHKR